MTFTDEMTSQQRWELELQTLEVGTCTRCSRRPASFGFATCAPCRTTCREREAARRPTR